MAAAKSGGRRSLNLALQGGGSHGAYTWGVLDTLFTQKNLHIEAITASSAGAVNATIAVQGYLRDGPDGARQSLHEFWRQVSQATALIPLHPSLMDKWLGNMQLNFSPSFMAMDFMTRMFSPYQFNLFDINPLRNILDGMVDFELLQKNRRIKLFFNATNVKTGKTRVFHNNEITLDVVMASCCLPFIFKAVEVDGEHYWDGGYSGNPALFPLFHHSDSSDIALVQIYPLTVDEVPTRSAEIIDRVNEISFNSSLMGEMRAIAFVRRLIVEGKLSSQYYKKLNIHMIQSQELLTQLGRNSKLNADWEFLRHVHDIGAQAAEDWLSKNFQHIGERSTVDIGEVFL